jgi:O-antigen ligase
MRCGAIVLAVFSATPLALVTGLFLSHDTTPKLILILTGSATLLIFLHTWIAWIRVLWSERYGRFFLCLVMAQALSLLLSTVFSSQPNLSIAGTVWRRFGLVEQAAILVVATALACEAAVRPIWTVSLFRVISVCGGAAAIYGIAQFFGFDPFLPRSLYSIEYLGGLVRPPSTMGHAIYFSAYLVPVTIFAADAAVNDVSKKWRTLHAAAALLGCLAIVLSGTRGAVLAMAAAGGLLIWRMKPKGSTAAGRKLLGAGALLLIVIAGIGISPAGANLRHRAMQWQQDPGGTRLGVWRDCLPLIASHPLLGTGPETFAAELRARQSVALSRAFPDHYHETPHNIFLDAACGQGLAGAAILGALLILGWKSGRAVDRAALLGMAVCGLFASLTLVTSMYLWGVAGLAVSRRSRKSEGVRESETGVWAVPAAALALTFLAIAAALTVQDFSFAAMGKAVAAQDSAGASRAYRRATAVSLGMPGYDLWSSRQFASLARSLGNSPAGAGAWMEAAEAASRAERTGEEPFSAAYQSSLLAIGAGNALGGEAKAREAIYLAPTWYKPHLLRSQILQAMGRNDEAAKEARVSAELGWRGK